MRSALVVVPLLLAGAPASADRLAEPATAPPPVAQPAPPPVVQPAPFAQPALVQPAPPPTSRQGYWFGIGLGYGNLQPSSSGGMKVHYNSLALDLRGGGMLTPRLALGLALWGTNHTEQDTFGNDLHVAQSNIGVLARFWVRPELWLEGGVGSARLTVGQGSVDNLKARGASLRGAIGYEVLHRMRYALDLTLGLWAAAYRGPDLDSSTTGNFEIAFTWY